MRPKIATEWTPASERLPDDQRDVLVAMPHEDGSKTIAIAWFASPHWMFYSPYDRGMRVTHWMPLPEEPA